MFFNLYFGGIGELEGNFSYKYKYAVINDESRYVVQGKVQHQPKIRALKEILREKKKSNMRMQALKLVTQHLMIFSIGPGSNMHIVPITVSVRLHHWYPLTR